jgi:hypothetical protein
MSAFSVNGVCSPLTVGRSCRSSYCQLSTRRGGRAGRRPRRPSAAASRPRSRSAAGSRAAPAAPSPAPSTGTARTGPALRRSARRPEAIPAESPGTARLVEDRRLDLSSPPPLLRIISRPSGRRARADRHEHLAVDRYVVLAVRVDEELRVREPIVVLDDPEQQSLRSWARLSVWCRRTSPRTRLIGASIGHHQRAPRLRRAPARGRSGRRR